MSILEPGQTIRDTYEVERYLAEGAFAEVYRVRHRFFKRQAMKVFKRVGMTREELEDMMAEAVLLSRIAHPNVVQVFDANVLETQHGQHGYFTMENIPGGSLDKFWRSHGASLVPIETTIDLLKQVCRGLQVAHSQDPPIVHRDIKPQNILIGYEADGLRARLGDFGLAKQVNPLTLFATAAGTLAFKPPEAFTQEKGDSLAGDIWALGVTLYLLLTDRLPYEVDPVLGWGRQQVFRDRLCPPSQQNVQVNAELDGIIMRCLAANPKDRYPCAGDLLAALEGWRPDPPGGKQSGAAGVSSASKDVLGVASSPNQAAAKQMARQAMELAEDGQLMDAADLMEEALNKWPSLRERYARRVELWRRGIST
jgi:serine/threonine-protein kinase